MAFYGLAASELDLFTLAARSADASLVFVVDPGPMGLARRVAEIAGVPASADPWDLPGLRADWIVLGGLAHSRGAPIEQARNAGARLLEAAEVGAALEKLSETIERSAAAAMEEEEADILGDVAGVTPVGVEVPESKKEEPTDAVASTPEDEADTEQRGAALPELERAAATPPESADAAPEIDEPSDPDDKRGRGTPGATESHAAYADAVPESDRPSEAEKRSPGLPPPESLHPLESGAEPATVVNWALEGLMSSVKGRWGAAVARANDHVHFVEKGIDIKGSRPELWQWLNGTMRESADVRRAPAHPPQVGGSLAWAMLRAEGGLVGVMLLGREEGSVPFSSGDRTWLERVGERVASILSHTSGSVLAESRDREREAPPSVWAGPLLERVKWTRGWLRELSGAREVRLFMASEAAPVARLIDEESGSAGPAFLQEFVREALERKDPQVWLEKDGDRALVLQPLSPWGARGVLLLESVPWRGDGAAILARLKKAAAKIGRLLSDV
jgi:hypothetical protein